MPPLGLLQHCFVRSESSRTSRQHSHAGGSTVCLAGARLRKRHETFPTRRGGRVVPDAAVILPIDCIAGQLSTRVERVIGGTKQESNQPGSPGVESVESVAGFGEQWRVPEIPLSHLALAAGEERRVHMQLEVQPELPRRI
jgi:hypothetical protein